MTTETPQDTPRTDAAIETASQIAENFTTWRTTADAYVPAHVARKIERLLSEANAALEQCHYLMGLASKHRDELEADIAHKDKYIEQQAREVSKLDAARQAAERDAERYRKLISKTDAAIWQWPNHKAGDAIIFVVPWNGGAVTEQNIDAAVDGIDAARSEHD